MLIPENPPLSPRCSSFLFLVFTLGACNTSARDPLVRELGNPGHPQVSAPKIHVAPGPQSAWQAARHVLQVANSMVGDGVDLQVRGLSALFVPGTADARDRVRVQLDLDVLGEDLKAAERAYDSLLESWSATDPVVYVVAVLREPLAGEAGIRVQDLRLDLDLSAQAQAAAGIPQTPNKPENASTESHIRRAAVNPDATIGPVEITPPANGGPISAASTWEVAPAPKTHALSWPHISNFAQLLEQNSSYVVTRLRIERVGKPTKAKESTAGRWQFDCGVTLRAAL